MKKVILHIGNHKTGSTAIQHTLALNKQKLLEHGVVYSGINPVTQNHVELACAILKEALQKCDHLKDYPLLENSSWNAEKILEEIFMTEGKTVVISYEGLFSETFRGLHGLDQNYDPGLEKFCNSYIREWLAEHLKNYADETVVVCYLRRQDLFLEALYNEYIKNPWTKVTTLPRFREFIEACPAHLDYAAELKEWEQYYGKSEMIIRNYEEEFLPLGVARDFLETAVQLSDEEITELEEVKWEDTNPRMSRDALETKKIIYPKMPGEGTHEIFRQYILEHQDHTDYAYFSYQKRVDLMEELEESNAVVARVYLGRKPEPLFWNQNYFIPVYEGLTEEKFDEIMKWILQKLEINPELL